jgi:hypothetical protein
LSAYEDSEDKAEARDLAMLAAQVSQYLGAANYDFETSLPIAWDFFGKAAAFITSIPAISALNPASLEAPGPDSEMVVTGTGFTASTVINWNGGDEPTDFVSATEVKTTVRPSTVQAPLPFTLRVCVHNAGVKSNVLDFTFTEAPAGRSEKPWRKE